MRNKTREDIQRDRAELKLRFGDAYAKLQALLFDEDPIGINFGTNKDEYGPEVRTILPRLASCRTVEEIRAMVHTEFCSWFDAKTAGSPAGYQRIAQRIHDELPDLLRTDE